jgi:hypothetical protein
MAISILELNKNLQGVLNDLAGGAQQVIMAKIAEDANVLFKKRIVETGKDAKGKSFPPYSTSPMLAGRKSFKTDAAFNKIAGSKDKRRDLKWVTIGGSSGFSSFLSVSAGTSTGMANEGKGVRLFEIPGGYKEFRELHDRQTRFVDFSFSNDMWNDVKVKSNKQEGKNQVAIIGATAEKQIKKLEGNTKRKGEIMALSQSEEMILAKEYEREIVNIFRKNGLK